MTGTIPNFYINAFYESKFKDNLFVIKAGGKIIEDSAALDNLLQNIKQLTLHGIKVLFVYGGGEALDRAVEERGIGIKRENGRRVTDAATMDIMKQVVGGTLSLAVYEAMARNSMEGLSLNAVPADWMKVELRPKTPVDYGFVGDIHGTQSRPVNRLFRVTNFIACACIATTADGTVCNINADTIATSLAVGLKAHKLIFLSDVDGVQIGGTVAGLITSEQIPAYIADGVVTGGMKVKLENCLQALEGGVRRIHLINGLRADSLKKEIYEPVGPGTMLIRESERESYANEVQAQHVIEARKAAS